MHSSIAIDIGAPPALVFALARDVRRWPDLLPHYVAVEPLGEPQNGSVTARMIARRPLIPVLGLGLPVAWRAVAWSEPDDRRLRFRHLGGATKGMDVTWRIEAANDGCRVTIDHRFAPRFGPWALFVDRVFTRPIATRTLATFKAIAEAVATGGSRAEPRPRPKCRPRPERLPPRAESGTGEQAYPVR
jgi:ribosome-associated toxin RatA of RatAB toxin-antitoxin module